MITFTKEEITALASNLCVGDDTQCIYCNLATIDGCLIALVRYAKEEINNVS